MAASFACEPSARERLAYLRAMAEASGPNPQTASSVAVVLGKDLRSNWRPIRSRLVGKGLLIHTRLRAGGLYGPAVRPVHDPQPSPDRDCTEGPKEAGGSLTVQVPFPRSGPVYLMGSYYDPPMLQARRRAISFASEARCTFGVALEERPNASCRTCSSQNSFHVDSRRLQRDRYGPLRASLSEANARHVDVHLGNALFHPAGFTGPVDVVPKLGFTALHQASVSGAAPMTSAPKERHWRIQAIDGTRLEPWRARSRMSFRAARGLCAEARQGARAASPDRFGRWLRPVVGVSDQLTVQTIGRPSANPISAYTSRITRLSRAVAETSWASTPYRDGSAEAAATGQSARTQCAKRLWSSSAMLRGPSNLRATQ